MKWIVGIVVVLLLLAIGALFALDPVAKKAVEAGITKNTGLDTKIGKLEIGVFSPKLTIEDFKIYNSAAFGGSPLLDLKELHVEYDRDALKERRLHFKLVRLHLNEVSIVRGMDGKLNIGSLSKGNASGGVKGGEKTEVDVGGKKHEFAGIDVLNLSLGKLRYVDMKEPGKVNETSFGTQNEIILDIKTEEDLRNKMIPILLKALPALSPVVFELLMQGNPDSSSPPPQK
ncbi:MAG: hypothetical protein EXS29_08460 [Pedosphaera sp.]|nr:hypothetical protein [Pedosphaera sp.]